MMRAKLTVISVVPQKNMVDGEEIVTSEILNLTAVSKTEAYDSSGYGSDLYK